MNYRQSCTLLCLIALVCCVIVYGICAISR